MSELNSKYYSRRNLDFLLVEVLDVLALTKHNYFAQHDADSFAMVLDTADRIAEKNMKPYLKTSDKQPPEIVDGHVKVHSSIHDYYKAFCESGLMESTFGNEYGGQQLPRTIYAAADFIIGNAHNGYEMFTSLAKGAARLIVSFASPVLIEEYATKILSGEYAATMCLTETGAGSSLSDITTEAELQSDGSYKIKGQKIFISAGDHDITNNIVHLVLARIKNAPRGTKGISLFVVPKKKLVNGKLIDNDVASIGIYHKMGQKSTPAMHLEFGGTGNCSGWLIGEAGAGLSYMFQMMNGARLGVGLGGTTIASAAYYLSLQYANERPQGRRLQNKSPNDPPVTIIHHPDVRRMLFLQKAIVEGSLSFILQCYKYADLEKISEGESKKRYNELQELLTPVAKTYGAEMGIVSVNNGLQVLGGYGYTEDFPLEQLARDVRIMSLYEGTSGIQSLALLGRQIPMNNGIALQYWKEELMPDIKRAQQNETTAKYAEWMLAEIEQVEDVTGYLLKAAAESGTEIFLSDASLYMEMFSLINIAWQWLKQATVAAEKLNRQENAADVKFYRSKIETMQFFFHYELIKTKTLATRLKDPTVITVLKEEDLLM